MALCNQVCLLMWKNWLVQKRNPSAPIFELLLPVVFSLIFVLLRNVFEPSKIKDFTYFERQTVVVNHDRFQQDGIIGYTPESKATDEVMGDVLLLLEKFMPPKHNMSTRGFASEEESLTFYQMNSEHMQHIIVFHGVSSGTDQMPRRVSFTIRPHSSRTTWLTQFIYPLIFEGLTKNHSTAYRDRAVLLLQSLVGESLARYWIARDGRNPNSIGFEIYTKRFAFPPHYNDSFLALMLITQLPVFTVLSFILSVTNGTKNVVVEKEKKLKESMKLMGLTPAAYWISWYLTVCVLLVPGLGMYTLILTLPVSSKGPVLVNTDGSLIFVILLCYAHAMITFSFMISSFVNKGEFGEVLSALVYYAFFTPFIYLVNNYETVSRGKKLPCCLFFNTAIGMALREFVIRGDTGEGANWSNFSTAHSENDITLLECMIMMLISSCIHILITWYLDNVRPGEFGVPKPWNFCFTKSYWSGSEHPKEGSFRVEIPQGRYFEKDPTGRVAGIRVCNLRKEFGSRVAVAGTSMNMYEGQITVLLGHNGAGKTTTMSMITGFIPPTSGTAIVNGYDIRTDIDKIRSSLGLCPQHNILFDSITVSEHFRFFSKLSNRALGYTILFNDRAQPDGRKDFAFAKNSDSADPRRNLFQRFVFQLKGYSSPTLNEEILELSKKVGLENKLDTYSVKLSGGQKRKLSVGIALIGGPKVVILDEPTSGMDPAARRQAWSILQEAREGRTILLTTHHMDEADVLGDRIAIMAGGVIKCCGTSLFLKKQYGTGYHLVVVRTAKCDVSNLTNAIHSVIPKAMLETVVSTEVTFLLPETQSDKFANLFRMLDSEKGSLNISSFGATATTMEEVFLKVGEPTHESDFVARTSIRSTSSKSTRDSHSADGVIYLTVTKQPESDIALITELVQRFFPSAQPMNVSRDNVTYPLPNPQSEYLADLSKELENKKQDLKIITFTTSLVAIVEEAVFKTKPVRHSENVNSNAESSVASAFDFNTGFLKQTGFSLELSRMRGIFVKKALLTWRRRPLTLVQLVLPGLFAFMVMRFGLLSAITSSEPPLTFNILPFGKTNILYTDGYSNATSVSSALADLYKKQFCSCHSLEYFKLENAETFDNVTARRTTEMDKQTFIKKMIIGFEVVEPRSPDNFAAVAYYNSEPYHSEPVSVNYLVNTFLQFALNTSFSFKSAIHPLKLPFQKDDETSKTSLSFAGTIVGISIAFGMTTVSAIFVAVLIQERQSGAKHMQIMTGISPVTYWLPTFLWDFIIYFVSSLAIPVMFALYNIKAYTEDGRWTLVILVLIDYGWAMLPLVYLLHFLFKSPPTGISVVEFFFLLSGSMTTVTVMILSIAGSKAQKIAEILDIMFTCLFSSYNLASSLKNIAVNYKSLQGCLPLQYLCLHIVTYCCKDKCGDKCVNFEHQYTSIKRPGIGLDLIAMAVQGLLFFLVLILIEYKVFHLIWYTVFTASSDTNVEDNIKEDSDVAAERMRINSTPISVLTSKDSLVLVNLYKKYPNLIAVDHICVGIPDRECFGLLGQNGAGKTTTFKMLTGDILLTGGNAYLKGFDIKTHIQQVQANIGYCPQFDPLFSQLTGRETLTLYARLRGIPEDSIGRVVVSLIEFMMLSEYLDELCGNYSGGNKKKLSTAISIIGDSPFIMLDEPSSGLDPEARRNLWTVLSKIRASGRTLVLSSHSMEECDALCTRIAIMVNGRLKCLGSPQHLKNKFGQGYTLITKLRTQADGQPVPSGPVVAAITTTFPGSAVFDAHEGYIHFQVPDATVKLADIFSLMELLKQQPQLEDYSVHQTTLEQVFLSFTKAQAPAAEDVVKESKGFFSRCCPK